MSDYRIRNGQLAVEMQPDPGVEEAPDAAADAIKVRTSMGYSPNFDSIDTDYLQASLTQSAPITGGGNVGFTLPCFLKGSGTAGTAPDFGKLIRACGLSETLTAAAVSDTAQAGAASTITLHAGASAVDEAYKGMLISTTGGTGPGQTRVIAGYVGSTKVATVYPAWTVTPDETTTFSVHANAAYRPVSVGLERVSIATWQHSSVGGNASRRRRLMDGMGTFRLGIPPRGLATIDFTMTGNLPAAPDDVSKPSAPTYQSSEPGPFLAAQAYLGGAKVKFAEFSFDLAGDVQQFDDPEAAYGYGPADILNRVSTGSITPNLTLNSARDAFSDWLGSTSRALWLNWGPAAGKRVSLYFPALRYTGNTPGETRGFATEQIPFRSVAEDGEVWMCIY
ncbi:hypothetical protein STVA_41440 [Allostella vacuolata]|nr:hypothetical protein STVA_41440 [Stella vacuolata]